jgi:hypothetical protein
MSDKQEQIDTLAKRTAKEFKTGNVDPEDVYRNLITDVLALAKPAGGRPKKETGEPSTKSGPAPKDQP